MFVRLLSILLLLFILGNGIAFSQNWRFIRHEVMFGVGASNFLGELGGNDGIGLNGFQSVRDLEFSLTRPVFTIGYRYKLTQSIGLRSSIFLGRVDGDDTKTLDPWRRNRNLHFKSVIAELSGVIEWYPFSENFGHVYRLTGAKGKKVRYFSPYFFGGGGAFLFNPKAKYQRSGAWESLYKYKTEQTDYKRYSAAIIYGMGFKYALDKQWSIGLEFGMRKTFTDYIDDVSTVYIDQTQIASYANSNGLDAIKALWFADPNLSLPEATVNPGPISAGEQRGDNSDLDSYMFAIFSIHYRLLRGRFHLPKF